MKSFDKIFIERFNELTTHRQLHYEIIINIKKKQQNNSRFEQNFMKK